MGSELVHPSVDHLVDRKFSTCITFYELQLSCLNRVWPKYAPTLNVFFSVIHCISYAKFGTHLGNYFILIKLNNKRNCFFISSPWANVGIDLKIVEPCIMCFITDVPSQIVN